MPKEGSHNNQGLTKRKGQQHLLIPVIITLIISAGLGLEMRLYHSSPKALTSIHIVTNRNACPQLANVAFTFPETEVVPFLALHPQDCSVKSIKSIVQSYIMDISAK